MLRTSLVTTPYLWTILLFAIAMGAAYHLVGRTVRPRDGLALMIGFAAAWPLLEGGFALERELARRQHGRVNAGVVLTKLSSTGEDGSRTIGRSYRRLGRSPFVNTANGFRVHDVLTRLLLTGSPRAWVVDYRYPCASPAGCVGRDFVPHELWTRLRPGQTVGIRSADERIGSARLSDNADLASPAVTFAMGGLLAMLAIFVSRGSRPRQKYVSASAVVTGIESIPSGDTIHWRVTFAYFDEAGRAREGADEVYRLDLKPGDDCVVRYPDGHPDLGTLDLRPAAAA